MKTLPSIKTLVKNTTAKFICYRDGDLWYSVEYWSEAEGPCTCTFKPQTFEFPVPVSDTGTGIFPNEIKAITLMRWINKHRDKMVKVYAEANTDG